MFSINVEFFTLCVINILVEVSTLCALFMQKSVDCGHTLLYLRDYQDNAASMWVTVMSVYSDCTLVGSVFYYEHATTPHTRLLGCPSIKSFKINMVVSSSLLLQHKIF